jgi:hypothetical protein
VDRCDDRRHFVVASLPRPGGNVTGFTPIEGSLGGKWVELLKEIAPRVARVTLLFNPAMATFVEGYLNPFSLWSPSRNAATLVCASESLSGEPISTPIRRIRSGFCPRAVSGHATATPPIRVTNARRPILAARMAPGLPSMRSCPRVVIALPLRAPSYTVLAWLVQVEDRDLIIPDPLKGTGTVLARNRPGAMSALQPAIGG